MDPKTPAQDSSDRSSGDMTDGPASRAEAVDAAAAKPGAAQPPPTPSEVPKTIKPRPLTVILMAGVALAGVLLILWAWRLWPFTSTRVATNNSYVRGQITVLAPQVNGYVVEVPVSDFSHVKKDQVLVRIDDRIYRQQLQQALADLDNRRASLANAEQTLASNRATEEARRAELFAAEAEFDRARIDQDRVNELAERGSVSERERDQIRAGARKAQAAVMQARAAINIAGQGIKSTEVSRGSLQAQVRQSEAAVELAQINLANTVIHAPRDGQLSEASVRVGQYVSAGTQLMYLVPETLWIVANYKETQTHHMRIGQRASFEVDALGGAVLTGRVEEIAPATGSEFSVLRPDNATGNFTKVVQRIPVRIAIDAGQPLSARLRPGMSVITHVDTAGVPDAQDGAAAR